MFCVSKKYRKRKNNLYLINYYLYKNKTAWSANIHQLNSDVLKRHILPKIKTNSLDLRFSFCEAKNTGQIKDSQDIVLGLFSIS